MSRHPTIKERFNLVVDPDDWRNPIDAVIDLNDFCDVGDAVIFYTSTELEIAEHLPDGKCRVTAVGYRNGPSGP